MKTLRNWKLKGGEYIMMSKCFFVPTLVGLIFALGFASPNSLLAAAGRGSLVGYWAFDEGKGDIAKDYSENGNDGILKGGPKWVDGKFGSALEFDGVDDYVEVPNMAGIAAFDEGTIELWVNLTTWDNYDNLFGTQTEANNLNVIRFERGYNGNADKVRAIFGDRAGQYQSVFSDTVLKTGTWTHLALTWSKAKSSATVYLNGVPTERSITRFQDIYPAVRIGTGYAGRFTEGLIDEVRMWSKALSQKELEGNMKKGKELILTIHSKGKLSTSWGRIKVTE